MDMVPAAGCLDQPGLTEHLKMLRRVRDGLFGSCASASTVRGPAPSRSINSRRRPLAIAFASRAN